ncbi:MAG: glycosyltransferase family 9 protein, partial [Desulfovibrio sp.]|nr:glycosyltransferase family 9 protein [Desulfovibrio sp.]
MSADPILILQMQRMGDLLLSFPLLLDLKRLYPQNPLWVVAEPTFFTPLLHVAPNVTFFPPAGLNNTLLTTKYFLVCNISMRQEAAAFMEKVQAERLLGPHLVHNSLFVHGFWHLYRHQLTQNNRHNTLHWADLYRLDLYPKLNSNLLTYRKVEPRVGRKIGLVLGASSEHKRPDLHFWRILAKKLQNDKKLLFFFGGQGEAEMGEKLAASLKMPESNLCG